MSAKRRVGVLASGSGSNLQALIDAASAPDYPARLVVVGSNVPTARALARAQEANIPVEVLPHSAYPDRDAYEEALVAMLQRHQVELVCLAGFMRLLGPVYLRHFSGKTLNIHPSLLPAFPGLHGARQALQYGVKVAGCTVHLVDAGTDTGPILGQAAVPVLEGDDEAALAARILAQEHLLYPRVLRLWVEGRLRLEDRRVSGESAPHATGLALSNPGGP